jgi:hypothetical protein
MTIEKIRDFYNAQPFRPFVIHLADGRELPVHHRDFIASAPSGRTVTLYQPDDSLVVPDKSREALRFEVALRFGWR